MGFRFGRGHRGAVLAACVASSALAQSAPSTPRRIAPESFPEYRQSESVIAPTFSAVPPTASTPSGACDRTMQRSVRLRCLRETADLTSRRVSETTAEVKAAIEGGDGATAQKRFWLRSFDEAQEKWVALRDQECQQVAPSEPGLMGDSYEARMLCLLRENERRRADLIVRYRLESR
jgi:uncharacterized protein YecT (DUF1311 family)